MYAKLEQDRLVTISRPLLPLALLTLIAVQISCQQTKEEPKTTGIELTKVKLLLNWFPEAEHGGFFAAQVHGFYEEAGLDVEIQPGGPNAPVIQQVGQGAYQFGISNADGILLGRAEGAPVVALMAPLQTSPRCLIVHKKSGITGFDGLKDMTLAMSSTQAFSFYLRKKFPLENVQIVPYPGSIQKFLTTEDFGQQGYVFSEPHLIEKNGGDPLVLMLSEIGFNPYTSCLITSEKYEDENPELVKKFLAASRKGWEKYLQDPAATNQKIHELNPEMSLDVLEYGVKALDKLVWTEESKARGLGVMTLERWEDLYRQMIEIEQVKEGSIEIKAVFRE